VCGIGYGARCVALGMELGVKYRQFACDMLPLSDNLICFVLNRFYLLLVFCCKTTCHSLITSECSHVLRHARVDLPFTRVSTFMC
jgi:hypothetical protein